MEQTQFWLPSGTLVGGRYTLERVLGKGGYGITYRGTDNRLLQSVAVKEYYPVFWCSRYADKGKNIRVQQGMESQYCKGLERFLEEARTLAQLSGISGVVRVTDFFEENGTAYLVMEYLEGRNLKQVLDGYGGRIPPEVLFQALSPALFALKKVHEKGLIHRDLSPDNIMMLSDGTVRLIDFGNARDTSDNKSMTMAMKEGFAAPEQYRSKGQGQYTDVYGICATVYYCLTGKLPTQAMERLMGAPLLRPSELGVALEPWQETAILDGLELFVQKRIPTVEQLWQRLYIAPAAPAPEYEPQPEPPVAEEIPAEEPALVPEAAEVQQPCEDWSWRETEMPEPEAAKPENPEPEESNPMDGVTVALVREEEPVHPVYEQPKPERYFVPPKAPEPQPTREPTLAERMQRFFRRR